MASHYWQSSWPFWPFWPVWLRALFGTVTVLVIGILASSCGAADHDNSFGVPPLDEGCWMELYEGENFTAADEPFRLVQTGEYEDLATLPGAEDDWTNQARSVKVGQVATVSVWAQPEFQGERHDFEPDSEHPQVDQFGSLRLGC